MGILDDLIPRPTAPPATRTLKRRAVTSSQTTTEEITITIAPDNTCGYISERLGASRACPLNDWCYFFPAVPAQSFTNGGVLCCRETSCQYHATCVNSEEYFVSSKCDGGCEVDNYTLKCSLLSQMTEAQTEGSVNAEATGTATSQTTATETNRGSGSSGTPVGAIAGGTVGGVAVLALIGVGVFFFLRRKKKSKASDSSKYQQAPGGDKPGWNQQQQQSGYYYDPNSPSAGYDGSPNGQYGYQQAGGYPARHQQPANHEAGGEVVGSIPQELPDSGPGEKKPVELA
ncbi:hypothetical protein FPCIR_6477 [Fusarium pseudocircinatum]|uniref:Uncharacterized protein n=1 Tax=Fusarium pseudocircinatum TaxID=56676 RepID=A0A8H5P577_9HYPO|nr:hypothetical protein FPCIR_6477 [Fusarium pseudocircinatum]